MDYNKKMYTFRNVRLNLMTLNPMHMDVLYCLVWYSLYFIKRTLKDHVNLKINPSIYS